jgi:hypothetical protein
VEQVKEIPLHGGGVAIVDVIDYARVSKYVWYLRQRGRTRYAFRKVTNTSDQLLHKFLVEETNGLQVDHENGDGLDNRRSNLRLATPLQNATNRRKKAGTTSPFKGVSRRRRSETKPWAAHIQIDGRSANLGSFANEEEAARRYDEAVRTHYGEFGRYNFPFPGEQPAMVLDG